MSKQKYPQTASTSSTGESLKKGRANYSFAVNRAQHNARRAEAEERDAIYVGLTIQKRIDRAKGRRGESKRELARLESLLANEPKAEKKSLSKKI